MLGQHSAIARIHESSQIHHEKNKGGGKDRGKSNRGKSNSPARASPLPYALPTQVTQQAAGVSTCVSSGACGTPLITIPHSSLPLFFLLTSSSSPPLSPLPLPEPLISLPPFPTSPSIFISFPSSPSHTSSRPAAKPKPTGVLVVVVGDGVEDDGVEVALDQRQPSPAVFVVTRLAIRTIQHLPEVHHLRALTKQSGPSEADGMRGARARRSRNILCRAALAGCWTPGIPAHLPPFLLSAGVSTRLARGKSREDVGEHTRSR